MSSTTVQSQAFIRRQPSHSDGGGLAAPTQAGNPYPTKSSAIARSSRLERIDLRQSGGTDAAYRPSEDDQAEVGDARIRCVEDILGSGIAAERRRAWRDGRMGDLRDDGRQVEGSSALGLKLTNAWINGGSGPRDDGPVQ